MAGNRSAAAKKGWVTRKQGHRMAGIAAKHSTVGGYVGGLKKAGYGPRTLAGVRKLFKMLG